LNLFYCHKTAFHDKQIFLEANVQKIILKDRTMLDAVDRKILAIMQQDCTMPVAEIGRMVGLSTTPCWRRIQKLEDSGVIQRRVALLDPKSVKAGE